MNTSSLKVYPPNLFDVVTGRLGGFSFDALRQLLGNSVIHIIYQVLNAVTVQLLIIPAFPVAVSLLDISEEGH